MPKNINTFENNIKQLEEIINQLESSSVDLDECVTLYEKGIKLSLECSKKLENAKQKIKIISDNQAEETK